MIEGSYGESGHDEKCEWASEACGCDSRKLLRAEIAVATKELTRLSVEIVKAKRERDEAREALLWTWDKAEAREEDPSGNTLAAVAAARAAEGGEDE
jgi:hypothetical protein